MNGGQFMLDEEKTKLMTRLAMYEQGKGKDEIPMSKYMRNDYISLNMVKTVITATFAYILILVVCVLYDVEGLMNRLVDMDVLKLGYQVLIGYVIFIVAYGLISYCVYAYKFKKVRKNLNLYHQQLRKLHQIQEEEDKMKEEIETGGNEDYDDSFDI